MASETVSLELKLYFYELNLSYKRYSDVLKYDGSVIHILAEIPAIFIYVYIFYMKILHKYKFIHSWPSILIDNELFTWVSIIC